MAKLHDEMTERARNAVKAAQDVRAYHRKRTKPGHPQRAADVANVMMQLKVAMRPIRKALGHAPYDPITETNQKRHDELRQLSKQIQTERRKLWKLRGGKAYKYRTRAYKNKHGKS